MTTARYCALITRILPADHKRERWIRSHPTRTWSFGSAPIPQPQSRRRFAATHASPSTTSIASHRLTSQSHGIARLVNDPKEKAKRWKERMEAFYPDRAKDYLLIEVTPEKLEVVNVKKGILGDPAPGNHRP